MRKLEEREPRKLYFFRSDSGRKMQKFSGDGISESDIKEYEIPDFLIEKEIKIETERFLNE